MVVIQNIMSIFREITVLTVLNITQHKPLRSGLKPCAVSGESASTVTLYLNVYQLWWFHPNGQLNYTTSTLSLPLLKGTGGENNMGSGVEIRRERSLSSYLHGQNRFGVGR